MNEYGCNRTIVGLKETRLGKEVIWMGRLQSHHSGIERNTIGEGGDMDGQVAIAP